MLGGSKMLHVTTGNTSVINCYGPTEFTVCSSYYILEQDDKHDNIPIGRPVPNSISVVIDTEGRLVPQGTVGELCLIGRPHRPSDVPRLLETGRTDKETFR